MIFARVPELTAMALAWVVASLLKVPFYYLINRRWNWSLVFGTGGDAQLALCVDQLHHPGDWPFPRL